MCLYECPYCERPLLPLTATHENRIVLFHSD